MDNNTYNQSTSIAYNYTHELEEEERDLEELRRYINLIFLPIIITIGITGNMLTFYVLNTSPLRHQSCNVYLAFLSLVDAGFLCCLIVVGTDFLRNTSVAHSNGFCQVLPFLTYVFGFLSVYTVVCFTVERFIVTFYPLKRQAICTRKRAKITLLFVSVIAIILFSFPLYMSDVIYSNGEQICVLRHEFTFAAHVLSCMDTILTMVLPALIILMLNTAIGVKLSKQFSKESDAALGRRMRTSVNGIKRTLGVMSRQSMDANARGTARSITAVKTTRTLLLVSSMFVLLNLPSHALRVYMLIISLVGHLPPHQVYVAQELAQFIYYVNFGSNIFLYSICSKAFRKNMKKHIFEKFCCRKRVKRAEPSIQETSGTVTLKLTTLTVTCVSSDAVNVNC